MNQFVVTERCKRRQAAKQVHSSENKNRRNILLIIGFEYRHINAEFIMYIVRVSWLLSNRLAAIKGEYRMSIYQ